MDPMSECCLHLPTIILADASPSATSVGTALQSDVNLFDDASLDIPRTSRLLVDIPAAEANQLVDVEALEQDIPAAEANQLVDVEALEQDIPPAEANQFVDVEALEQAIPAAEANQLVDVKALAQAIPAAEANQLVDVEALEQAIPAAEANQLVDVEALEQGIPAAEANQLVDVEALEQGNPAAEANQLVDVEALEQAIPAAEANQLVDVEALEQGIPAAEANQLVDVEALEQGNPAAEANQLVDVEALEQAIPSHNYLSPVGIFEQANHSYVDLSTAGIQQQHLPQNVTRDTQFGIPNRRVVPENGSKTINNKLTDKEPVLQSLSYQGNWPCPREDENKTNAFQEYISGSSLANSGNAFSDAYSDTVTSPTSSQFILNPADLDKHSAVDDEVVEEIYLNSGYSKLLSQDSEVKEVNLTKHDEEKEQTVKQSSDCQSNGEVIKEYIPQEIVKEPPSPFQHIEEFFHQHLIPVSKNNILSLDIQEITPSTAPMLPSSPHTEITNNLSVVDDWALGDSQSSLGGQGKNKHTTRAVTMQNIHDSFLNLTNGEKMGHVCQKALIHLEKDLTSSGSLASLNKLAAGNGSNKAQEVGLIDGTQEVGLIDSTQEVGLIDGTHKISVVKTTGHRRNVFILSFVITFLFIAMGSVRNLQSSLNQEGGVGIISMGLSFAGYMLGSVFSSSIVQNFRPRRCIVACLIPMFIYVAANTYPAVWLMSVVSLAQGIALAIIWNAVSTYITFQSRGRALKKNEHFEKVSSNYFGIFCFIYQTYHVIGNLIASLVLTPRSSTTNILLQNLTSNLTFRSSTEGDAYAPMTATQYMSELDSLSVDSHNVSLVDPNHLHLCGAKFCNHFEIPGSGLTVSQTTKYCLLGVYMACVVTAIVIAVFLLEPLNPRLFSSPVRPAEKLKQQLISLAKFSVDTRFLLLMPLLMFSYVQFGFLSGEVTMAFVTCPLGIHMVGYVMVCFGITSSVFSYISGVLCKYTGRILQIVSAAVLNLVVLGLMAQWPPTTGSLIPYFGAMAVWGVSDGVWNTQINSLMGVVFPDKYEEAYSGLRITQGLGTAILFSYSNMVCMNVKIYLLAGICVFSLICYLIMEAVIKHRKPCKQIILSQTSV